MVPIKSNVSFRLFANNLNINRLFHCFCLLKMWFILIFNLDLPRCSLFIIFSGRPWTCFILFFVGVWAFFIVSVYRLFFFGRGFLKFDEIYRLLIFLIRTLPLCKHWFVSSLSFEWPSILRVQRACHQSLVRHHQQFLQNLKILVKVQENFILN